MLARRNSSADLANCGIGWDGVNAGSAERKAKFQSTLGFAHKYRLLDD